MSAADGSMELPGKIQEFVKQQYRFGVSSDAQIFQMVAGLCKEEGVPMLWTREQLLGYSLVAEASGETRSFNSLSTKARDEGSGWR